MNENIKIIARIELIDEHIRLQDLMNIIEVLTMASIGEYSPYERFIKKLNSGGMLPSGITNDGKEKMLDEEQSRQGWSCTYFFPDRNEEETEFGVCGCDPKIEPFADEIGEDRLSKETLAYMREMRFDGNRDACSKFEEMEELDDSEMAELFRQLSQKNPDK